MESLYELWDWLMSRSLLEVVIILGVVAGIIIQVAIIIVRWLEERKNDRNGRR